MVSSNQRSQPITKGARVLVVDDDSDGAEAAGKLLETFGCEVSLVVSAGEALERIEEGSDIDLVFSDVVMPKTSGITLARLARERNPGMPIVLATGYPDAIDEVTDSGAIPLIKPYTIARLEAVFAEQLRVDSVPPPH